MGERSTSLAALNEAPKAEFVRLAGDVVEHSPWVAERAFLKPTEGENQWDGTLRSR
jgi:2-oxo-4-hydroxy-4-carboxy--5-ureidoimidazoline (OHCU) decarboxylase